MLGGLKRWVGKKLLLRWLEDKQRDLKEGRGMKMSKATQVSIVVAGCAILGAGLDSGISFIQTTPDFAWEGFARAVGVGLLGGLMFWLRSPKDKRDGDEERRKGSPTDGL